MSINGEMNKEDVVHIYNEILFSYKRKEIEPVVVMSMDLETVIQSEVSQKEKNKYCILTHICGIQKNDTDEFVFKAERETLTQKTNVWTPVGVGSGMNQEIGIDMYTLLYIKYITNENLLYTAQEALLSALWWTKWEGTP